MFYELAYHAADHVMLYGTLPDNWQRHPLRMHDQLEVILQTRAAAAMAAARLAESRGLLAEVCLREEDEWRYRTASVEVADWAAHRH